MTFWRNWNSLRGISTISFVPRCIECSVGLLLSKIVSQGYVKLESEDGLDDFVSKGIEMNGEMFGLVTFVRLEYCSTDVVNDISADFPSNFRKINALIWANVRARFVLSNITIVK
jgi:hypothetical protein